MTEQASRKAGILLESGTNEVEFLRFSLGAEQFGINVSKVCQILVFDPKSLSVPPHGGDGFLGFHFFRGKPISVYDLSALLSCQDDTRRDAPRLLLVCEFNLRSIGYVIDHVHGIHRSSWTEFDALDEVGLSGQGSVVGTVRVDEQIVMIIDLEAMMERIDPTMGTAAFESEIVPPTETNHPRESLRILYCEDSTIVQKVLLRALEKGGFKNFQVFGSGKAGLAWAKEHSPSDVDVIISDVEMPGMDGLTLCRELRSIEGWKDKPFIVFSSMVNDQMKVKCQSVGVNAAFSKPEAHLIVDAIDRLVTKGKGAP